jgi:membrane-associated phospholipid phosphatase
MSQELIIRVIADGAVMPVVLLGAYALVFKVPKDQRLRVYAQVLMAGLTAYLLAQMISIIYQPSGERPFELLGTVAGASFLNNPGFPSDHALFVTAITCAVWFETKQKLITIILVGLTIAICVGRVLALVHTPIDVIGGVLIALIGALWYLDA